MYKKILTALFLVIGAASMYAQAGLFDLYYDAPLQTANDILEEAGFELIDSRGNIGEYRSATNIFVNSILLLADPEQNTLVGWLIKYSDANTAENDSFILDTLTKLYGEKNHYDTDTEQLIWFLTDTRTVHVMYGKDEELIVLYYDSRHPGLFKLED